MRWRRIVKTVIASALVALIGAAASATVGGPGLAQVLGWDPVDQKIFCSITDLDESGYPPGLIYFDLKNGRGNRPVRVLWSRDLHDSTRARRWTAITRRLKVLPLEVATSIPLRTTVTRADTLRAEWGEAPRFEVVAQFLEVPYVMATTFFDPSVRLLRLYRIPGRNERIAVFSFIGEAAEGGYEEQVPILLGGTRADTLRVERTHWTP